MERKQELLMISDALKSSNAIKKVQEVCRQILAERIEAANIYDSEVRSVLIKVVSNMGISVDTEVLKSQKVVKSPVSHSMVIGCGVLGLIGLYATSYDSGLVRLLGGTMSIVAGFGAGYYLQNAKDVVQTSCEIKIVQNAADILSELDDVYANFTGLFDCNQLERKYSSILKWVQDLWSEGSDDVKSDIKKLLAKIKYEFVEFTPDLSLYFDSNQATDVEQPTTTLPAIRNMSTGDIVLNGHVIFPKLED